MAVRRAQSSLGGRIWSGSNNKAAWPPGGSWSRSSGSSSGGVGIGGGGRGAGGGRGHPVGGSLGSLNMTEHDADWDADCDEAWPQTEAELARFYQQQIMDAQQRHLEPLREDLADWLNKILGKCRILSR